MKKCFQIMNAAGLLMFLLINKCTAADLAVPTDPLQRVKTLGDITKLSLNTSQTPQQLIVNLILYALGFLGIFFVGSLIFAGYQWMMSRGEKEAIEKAQARIKNSVIGVLIILCSGIILNFASDAFYKATCTPGKDYYCPSSNPNPTGECRSNKDCETQFGSIYWKCDMVRNLGYGSCKYDASCQTDNDCTQGMRCLSGTCGSSCNTDGDCPAGHWCRGHVCLP